MILKTSVSSLVVFPSLLSPIHTMSPSASHFYLQALVWWHSVLRHHWSAFSETAYIHRLPWLKDWKCQPSRSWDLGPSTLIAGQYVVLICLANEELTFLSGCFFAEMTTAKELTTKAELWRQCCPFRPLWHLSVKAFPGSNVILSVSAPTILGLEKFNKNWAILVQPAPCSVDPGSSCRHLAIQDGHNKPRFSFTVALLVPHPPGVNWRCPSVEQIETTISENPIPPSPLPSPSHRAGTMLSAWSTMPAQRHRPRFSSL